MFSTLPFAHIAKGKHIIKAILLAFTLGLSGVAHAELQPLKIRLASDLVGPPHPAGITMAYLQERLPQVIPGSSMLVYYAGGLYRIPEAVEAMTEGNLEMAFGQFGKTASIEPYMSVVNGPLKDPNGMNFPQSKVFASMFLLPNLLPGSRLHVGFAVMLVLVAIMTVFVFRSFAGYRLQVGGTAPLAARYAGFSSRSALWSALMISGATAGLAGAFEVTGPIGQLLPSISPGYGFTAIIVAFVGRLHPVGAVFGGIVMSLFYIGGEMAQSRLGLPSALGWVFQGMLLFFLLACDTLIDNHLRWRARAA